MNSIEVVGGIVRKISGNSIDGLIGAFIENGNSKYSSFNGFESGSVLGKGRTHHYGAGVLLNVEREEKKGFYFQATGHAGGIKNNWSSSDFKEEVSYNTGHFYCGTVADTGYIIQAAKTLNCDVFGKFSWTYQKGDEADVNGENVEFAALNLIKTRLGTRVTFEGNSKFNAYCGLAWERDYNKKAKAKVNGYDVEVSGLTGNSLFFELGTSFKNNNWQFNLVASGYFGVHRGFNGSAIFTYSFWVIQKKE